MEILSHQQKSERSLERLLPRLEAHWTASGRPPALWTSFRARLERNWPDLFGHLFTLYGDQYDFFFHLEATLQMLADTWSSRPADLRGLDERREHASPWWLSSGCVGGALYVDLFSENLHKLKDQVPYFKKIGINYLHLMPLYAVRPGDNDGGYAVSNYRSLNPALGNMDDLRELTKGLREEGISLVLDFVFNHTADDHEWALKALEGNARYQAYYHMFPDRTLPDLYERNLREIFPTVRRGNFTWSEQARRWVWTTFNSYQWDLNYRNPEVLRAMAEEMFFLANSGVEVLRLDAAPFTWKQMGTSCENLPQAHVLIRALNAMARIAAPSLIFKSEAIVHPDDVVKYVDTRECQVSYNPLLMALMWEALATRNTSLLTASLRKRFQLPEGCTWANYLRCHDDIGWTFDDGDAAALGINAHDHRDFLNAFYTGQFEGSFARGIPFQHDEESGDMRISGTLASLAGLEQALEFEDDLLVEMAVRRIMLLRSVICSVGGFPLIYLGEEWGLLNDYSYVTDPAKEGDSRWVHRPRMKWEYLEELNAPDRISRRIYDELDQLIRIRKRQGAFQGVRTEFVKTGNPGLFAYIRRGLGQHILVVANFTDQEQALAANLLRLHGHGRKFVNIIDEAAYSARDPLVLPPYRFVWLQPVHD